MDTNSQVDRKRKIANVLETYFSDANLRWDKLMQSKINKDPDGFVPFSSLKTLARFKSLKVQEDEIKDAADTERGVARIKPFVLSKKEELDAWSIYVEGLEKPYHTEKAISEIFSRLVGHVSFVRIPADRNGKSRFFGYCFVEFDDKNNVEKAVALLNRYDVIDAAESMDAIKQEVDALKLRVMAKSEWNQYKEQYLAHQNARKRHIQQLWAEYQETKDIEPVATKKLKDASAEPGSKSEEYQKDVIALCHIRLETPSDSRKILQYFEDNKILQEDANDANGRRLDQEESQQIVTIRLLTGISQTFITSYL
ncbi:hypothetical protein DFQ28_003518 [Apophysomyces sp. BC1034]|nr:hypothetical protein DFQ30_003477 [Apophysomyces sp. BC1015]KAG0189350.1 hypothetical protein DFQ28_003518 [Apophysomyces sp. BC1034]